MGLLKKIFKPVSKVLDKIVPNEVKPFLPYAAAFAPFIAPGIMGTSVMQRALMGGGMNIFGQLAQEGNEGDINLLSAGLGALSGAMTAPGSGPTIGEGVRGAAATGSDAGFFLSEGVPLKGTPSASQFFQGISDSAQGTGVLASGQRFLGDTLVKGSNIMGEGIKQGLFTKAGAKAALLPAATATGDLMFAQAKRDQDEYDRMMEEESEADAASDATRAFAIRRAMEAQGATEEEILDAIAAAGYKAGGLISLRKGGRVGFSEGGSDFGGITEAVEKIEKEPKTFLVDKLKVTMKPGQSEMRAIIEAMYNDVDGVMPDDRKKEFYELYAPQMYRNGEMEKSEFEFIQTEILGKDMNQPIAKKDGGLMDLGGKEMDLRGGGFVPIGKKERADDVPARLSKNEFVMTADAVRAAGGGSVNEGAKRMYKVMNDLEARA